MDQIENTQLVGVVNGNRRVRDYFNTVITSPWVLEPDLRPALPPKLSTRTFGHAIEESLMAGYTRVDLETVLSDELGLDWQHEDPPSSSETKRTLISDYMSGWRALQMAAIARRVVTELDILDGHLGQLQQFLGTYDAGSGVTGSTKNLIFAATGPKPKIVPRDAMNNDIEIVENAEHCLVYEKPIPAQGLQFSRLVA